MLIWFIPLAAVVVFLVIQHFNFGIGCDDVLVSLLIGFCSLLVALLVCVGVCACSEVQFVEAGPEVKPIYAMNDIYVQRKDSKYVYMTFEEGKGLTTRQVGTDRSYINYTTDAPYVEIYEIEVRNPVVRFLFQFDDIFSHEYRFFIPETADVTNDFVIDLE